MCLTNVSDQCVQETRTDEIERTRKANSTTAQQAQTIKMKLDLDYDYLSVTLRIQ